MKENVLGSDLPIGVLARRSGCSVPTIRYYEQIGLLAPPKRKDSGHRVYDGSAIDTLVFVRRCREFGFTLDQVRQLAALSSSSQRDCTETLDLARGHLNEVREKVKELRALERDLSRFVQTCADACCGGPASQCSIISDLTAGRAAKPTTTGCCR